MPAEYLDSSIEQGWHDWAQSDWTQWLFSKKTHSKKITIMVGFSGMVGFFRNCVFFSFFRNFELYQELK
jgi:hypothetical protein